VCVCVQVTECAEVIGYYCPSEAVYPILQSHAVPETVVSPTGRQSALRILSAVLRGTIMGSTTISYAYGICICAYDVP